MSFLENPFAEEEEPAEEPIVSGNPFGTYDAAQRENDYNALFVQSTTLEERLRKQELTHAEKVAEETGRASQLREELISLSTRASRATLASSRHSHEDGVERTKVSAELAAARKELDHLTQTVVAELSKQVAVDHAKAATFVRAVQVFRSRISSSQPASLAADSQEMFESDVAAENQAGERKDEMTLLASLGFDTSAMEACVRELIAAETSDAASDDMELIAALLRHTQSTLRQHEQHAQEAARAYTAALHAQRWSSDAQEAVSTLARFLAVPSTGRCTAPTAKERRLEDHPRTATSEESEGAAANADLLREIQRLEGAIATLLRRADMTVTATQPACESDETTIGSQSPLALTKVAPNHAYAAALAGSLAALQTLKHETAQLGREVLFLRNTVLAPRGACGTSASRIPASDRKALDGGRVAAASDVSASPHRSLTGEEEALDTVNQTLCARMNAVEELLSSPAVAGGVPGMKPTRMLLEARMAFAESFLPLQSVCLKALASVNAQMQTQAYGAALLSQLALHDAELDAAVMQRLGEVPAPLLPPDWANDASSSLDMRDAAQWYLDQAVAECTDSPVTTPVDQNEALAQRLSALQAEASPLWERRQAAWRTVHTALADMLALSPDDAAAAATPSAAPVAVPTLRLAGEVEMEDAVADQMREATQEATKRVSSITQAVEQRLVEQEKKLSWFSKQPHAAPLKSLRAVEKECTDLTTRLHSFQSTVEEAESSHLKLPVLQEKMSEAKRVFAELQRQVVATEKEIEETNRAISQLSV